jgi:excisionase family DNA binding protein
MNETRESITERLRGRCTCSIEEAAEALGIGRSTAYAAAREGSLPVLKMRSRLLVPTAKLLAMLGCDAADDQAS